MPKIPCFSIDACADILHVSNDNLYKKCKSVYVLADDLIEEKNDFLMDFLSPSLCAELKKNENVGASRGVAQRYKNGNRSCL